MSKFDKIFEAREIISKEPPAGLPKAARKRGAGKKDTNGKNDSRKPEKSTETSSFSSDQLGSTLPDKNLIAENTTKSRGRPKAKRSDPTFIGFTTYIRKETHLKVKIALLQEGEGRELSELVETLLAEWVKS